MLVFAAFTPHTPLLIPNIGKENLAHLGKTIKAMESLNKELIEAKPETIIVFSGHHSFLSDHFIINLNTKYRGDFQEFSDLTTAVCFNGDVVLINEVRDKIEDEVPLVLKTENNLEYGTIAPLFYLTKNLPGIKVVPFSYSLADKETHFKLGKLLKEVIWESEKRIAVIAAGDLSHTLTKNSPGSYSKKGSLYDQLLIDFLKSKDIKGLLDIDNEIIEEAKECSFRSLLMLLGIIHEMNYEVNIISYEHPFGVGYLTVKFKI
ncbi:MAG: class III extradiol dioxygenase subunit B-like domain-containing protein [Patescibacteria group bacterium]|nr:class III extradiol dioxygenase subunit B-like domain-containing protein [Patescibacteria group bacterium]MDD5490479.1 class III extradiol dioxygenase subunit B-like domain-containing protein [Patescibacteria group bacterium]